jgi:hypothetical protein
VTTGIQERVGVTVDPLTSLDVSAPPGDDELGIFVAIAVCNWASVMTLPDDAKRTGR